MKTIWIVTVTSFSEDGSSWAPVFPCSSEEVARNYAKNFRSSQWTEVEVEEHDVIGA